MTLIRVVERDLHGGTCGPRLRVRREEKKRMEEKSEGKKKEKERCHI